jgi:hypothetical protein
MDVVTIQQAKNRNLFFQNWINIYVLPFKTMEIMASYFFFIHINVKEFKPKNPLNEILSLSFDIEPFESEHLWHHIGVNFAKDYERTHIINTFDGKKLSR